MEDFLLQTDTIFNKKFLFYIRKIGRFCDFETCGVITNNKIYFLKNYAEDIYSDFVLNPSDYYSVYSDIRCIFHSHPSSSIDFSEADLDNIYNSCLSSLVYSKKDDNFLFFDVITENKFIFHL